MQQAPSPLNPWLLSYILQNYKSHSRYEIDGYLIEAGYNPTDIEATWQAILSGIYKQRLVVTRDTSEKRDYLPFIAWSLVILVILLLLCGFFNIAIVEPLKNL